VTDADDAAWRLAAEMELLADQQEFIRRAIDPATS
jgi:hypothetical protein